MQGRPTAPQMIMMDQNEPLWYERTQDMSGYVLPDIISPPLDEQVDFINSTAQNENDFYVQNSVNPSPDEFFGGDQTEAVLGDDSIMFDNYNYSMLHTKIKEWLPNISTTEIDEFAKTSMIDQYGDYLPRIDSENSLSFSEPSKVDKKPSAAVVKKPRHLSIFECEVPYIKEEKDIFSSCTDEKSTFYLTNDIAEEVEVMTEEHDESRSKSFVMSSLCSPAASPEFIVDPKEEVVTTSEYAEELFSPNGDSSAMEETSYDLVTNCFGEDDLYSMEAQTPLTRVPPQLMLNIDDALVSSSQLLNGDLPDTPEVLRPVLKPSEGFDLINYLLASGYKNEKADIPAAPSTAPCDESPCVESLPEQLPPLPVPEVKYGRGKPAFKDWGGWSTPGPSTSTSGRPARKSATKFKKLMEEGRLGSILDSRSFSSEDEESGPKPKRRRRTSSSSRRRQNSESDRSSVCDSPSKYRERRDRNNISSKRSRQKRKLEQEQRKVELKELEEKNKKLRARADELAAVLEKVHAAWKEYLIKKENQ